MIKKILIFDFDGTLADSLQLFVEIFNRLASKYNYVPATRSQVEYLRGKSAREVISELKIPKYKLPIIFIEGKREFSKSMTDLKLFSGMRNILPGLKKNYSLGIVTSNSVENVNKFFKKNNIEAFDFIYSDNNFFGKGKVIKRLIKKYNFNAENLIYIGDEVRDIEAAYESGIKIISVSWGFNTRQVLLKNKPDAVVDTPTQLLAALKVLILKDGLNN